MEDYIKLLAGTVVHVEGIPVRLLQDVKIEAATQEGLIDLLKTIKPDRTYTVQHPTEPVPPAKES